MYGVQEPNALQLKKTHANRKKEIERLLCEPWLVKDKDYLVFSWVVCLLLLLL